MNTIRELKQQEKYKSMLKRKNKEKKIYKDKNASLQFEKQKLYRVLLNREKEIERLNNIIKTKDEGIKALTDDLCEESTKMEKAIDYINKRKQEREKVSKYAYDIRNDDFIKYCNIELNILKGSESNE